MHDLFAPPGFPKPGLIFRFRKYHVEEMDGKTVTTAHIANATTPIRAAREVTERDVTLRTSEPIWIRVPTRSAATSSNTTSACRWPVQLGSPYGSGWIWTYHTVYLDTQVRP